MLRLNAVHLAVCLLPLALAGCGEPADHDDPRIRPPLVRVATVERAEAGSRAFTGVVVARTQSDLGFRVAGKVLERRVETGQSVKRGQLLLRLDPADLTLQAQSQQRAVDAARARAKKAANDLARYRGRDFFWDPFCGSGTIVIEAALAALNRAPGLARKFAAQSWSCIPEDVWTQAREAARAAEFRGEYRILGTDIDSGSLAIAIANAKKAGVSKYIEFREADATRESLPCDRGVIVCNPPYGERMLEQRSAQRLYQAFGRHIKYADGWKKYIISSEPEFEHYFGKQAAKKRKLYNGRLQCNVYMYF